MLGLALLALAAGAGGTATDGAYSGRTTEGGKVSVVIERGMVTRVKATLRVYVCDPEGDSDPCSSPPVAFTARRPAAGSRLANAR